MKIKKENLYIKKNSLSKEVCKQLIDRFENDERKTPGQMAGGIDLNIKNTTDMNISTQEEWKDLDGVLYEILSNEITSYIKSTIVGDKMYFPPTMADTGYQIQKYEKESGFYDWHIDETSTQTRYIVYMWYLNDVEKGGETEFKDFKITPECGKLVMFPSTWEWPHKANVPISDAKYIITGWIVKK